MKISQMHKADRPREKMLARGPQSLGDGELIAVLLRVGSRGESAIELAQRMLQQSGGSLGVLFNTSLQQLQKMKGVGPGKAAAVAAAFELGKRFLQEESASKRRPLASARMIYDLMIPCLKGLPHEQCWMLWLNSANMLTGRVLVTSGGLESTVIDIRQIGRLALEAGASGAVLVHNHPSGDPRPSAADIRQTDKLRGALLALGIEFVDHVVVSDSSFYSFSSGKVFSGR